MQINANQFAVQCEITWYDTCMRSIEQRRCLIRRGLRDRKPSVQEAARQLLAAWLDADAGSSVPSLLSFLDVEQHEEEAELAVRAHPILACLQAAPWCQPAKRLQFTTPQPVRQLCSCHWHTKAVVWSSFWCAAWQLQII